MQERIDGSFSKIEKSTELLKRLMEDRFELMQTRAIHFGAEKELEELRTEKIKSHSKNAYEPEFKSTIEELNKRIEVLEKARADVVASETSPVIHLSPKEVEDFMIGHKRDFLKKKYKRRKKGKNKK